jgi:hypothetical protein
VGKQLDLTKGMELLRWAEIFQPAEHAEHLLWRTNAPHGYRTQYQLDVLLAKALINGQIELAALDRARGYRPVRRELVEHLCKDTVCKGSFDYEKSAVKLSGEWQACLVFLPEERTTKGDVRLGRPSSAAKMVETLENIMPDLTTKDLKQPQVVWGKVLRRLNYVEAPPGYSLATFVRHCGPRLKSELEQKMQICK